MPLSHTSLGTPVPDWTACAKPSQNTLHGHYCTLKLFDLETHSPELFKAIQDNQDHGASWQYLPYGPCYTLEEFRACMQTQIKPQDTLLYTIFDNPTQKPVGIAGYLRIQPELGSIEIGHLHFSKHLQKTPAATEAIYLLLDYALEDLQYRRCEWKCNHLNEASRKAAVRFGFQFEGTFRQAAVFKGYNRDTDWFSIIDREWPNLNTRFLAWLNPNNFDANGQQIKSLQECIPIGS